MEDIEQPTEMDNRAEPLVPQELSVLDENKEFALPVDEALVDVETPVASQYEDLTLECRDCGSPFIFTAGEREWFAAHNFVSPARCPRCRKASKEQVADSDRQQLARTGFPYQNQAPQLPPQGNVAPNYGNQIGYNSQSSFGNQSSYYPSYTPGGYNANESSGFTYRTYCRRCGGEARVPYTGRSNQPILCRVCRDPNSAQNLAN